MLIMKVFVRSADKNNNMNSRNSNNNSYFNSDLSSTSKHKIISVTFKEKIKITTTVKSINIFRLLAMLLLISATVIRAAPHAVSDNSTTSLWSSSTSKSAVNHNVWPPLKHYDIWNDHKSNYKLNDYDKEENDEMSTKESEELYEDMAISSIENFALNNIDLVEPLEQFVNVTNRQSKGKLLLSIIVQYINNTERFIIFPLL